MPLLTESEVLERAERYLRTIANIRRMGRAVSHIADFRGNGVEDPGTVETEEGLDNPTAIESDSGLANGDIGTEEQYQHSRLGLNGRPLENPRGTGHDRESTGIQANRR